MPNITSASLSRANFLKSSFIYKFFFKMNKYDSFVLILCFQSIFPFNLKFSKIVS